jgi:two-component system, OmpR family, response regulator
MRVLIAEDEKTVAQNLGEAVVQAGFTVDISYDGEDAWFRGSTEKYAAIILDLGLPTVDGLTVLRRWRAEGITIPILILSARGSWSERVDGIDSGADDYLPKPFQMREVVSRLHALVRRAGGHAQSVIEVGPLRLDLRSSQASIDDRLLKLTALEFRLIHFLTLNSGNVVSLADISESLYDHDHDRDVNAVEAIVSRLRRKLGPGIIQNKRGFGYFISDPIKQTS